MRTAMTTNGVAMIESCTTLRRSVFGLVNTRCTRSSNAVAYENPTSRYWRLERNTWSTNADHAPVAARTTTTGRLSPSPPTLDQPRSDRTRRRSRTPTATTNTAAAPVASSPTLGLDQNANAHAAPTP